MTFAEKYQQDHPSGAEHLYLAYCPDRFGYEKTSLCAPAPSCEECWNREMEEKKDGSI